MHPSFLQVNGYKYVLYITRYMRYMHNYLIHIAYFFLIHSLMENIKYTDYIPHYNVTRNQVIWHNLHVKAYEMTWYSKPKKANLGIIANIDRIVLFSIYHLRRVSRTTD